MRISISYLLKSNQYLDRSLLNGRSRISSDKLPLQDNNLQHVEFLQDKDYSKNYAFSQDEVDELLQSYNKTHECKDVQ